MQRPVSARRIARQSGNAMIEFALSATLMLTLVIGVIGFARIANVAALATGAADAGVQYGALSPGHYGDLVGMQNAALADTGNYPGATATATQFCTCSIGGTQGACPASCGSTLGQTYVQVVVTIPYSSVITMPTIPNPVTLSHTACARVQ